MFLFTLCLELGIRHPDYLLLSLSSKQLSDWQAFYKYRPFGQDLGYHQAAIIACMIANVNLKKGKKPFEPKDFIPKFGEKLEGWEIIKKTLSTMATKKVKRKKKNNG